MFNFLTFYFKIMPDLNKDLRHVAHLSRTGFDMGQKFGYTCSTGMLLPVYQDILNVGETVYVNSALIARTQPIVTASMVDVKFYTDWFFVPMSMLFTLFPNKRWMTNDLLSDFYNDNDGTTNKVVNGDLPLFAIDDMLGCYANGEANVSLPAQSVIARVAANDIRFGADGLNRYRLADHLGFNPYAVFLTEPQDATIYNPDVFPWQTLAYQCIYQNYYRDDTWERKDVSCYNVDSLYNQGTAFYQPSKRHIFQLRFRSRFKDYFFNMRPSPYLTAVNLLGSTTNGSENVSGSPLNILKNATNFLNNKGTSVVSDSGSSANLPAGSLASNFLSVDSVGSVAGSFSSSNIANLRQAFAVEKLLRVIGMSKKDYDSQVLAHFGFHVPHDIKHELTHLCGSTGILHIGEIVSSADTYDSATDSGSALGQIGGKGYVYIEPKKKPYKFTAPCDGVLMCISSCAPETRYNNGFDKQNSVTSRLDFFTPELDKLGAQPLYKYETDINAFINGQQATRLGWQSRYQQWKQKYNRCTTCFVPNHYNNQVNTFSPWFNSKEPFSILETNGTLRQRYNSMKVLPTELDAMMVVSYNLNWSADFTNSPWLIYQTDPFICDFSAMVKKVSTMSPTGEPDLNGI